MCGETMQAVPRPSSKPQKATRHTPGKNLWPGTYEGLAMRPSREGGRGRGGGVGDNGPLTNALAGVFYA